MPIKSICCSNGFHWKLGTNGKSRFKKRVIRLTNTKNDDARTVPLTKAATSIINKALLNPIRPKEIELIFFGELGRNGQRSPYAFNKVFGDLKAKICMADLHFHDLRHEAVSRFVEGGLSNQEVASISDHKAKQMLRRYTHLRAEDLVVRLDKLTNKLLRQPLLFIYDSFNSINWHYTHASMLILL